MEIHSKDLFAEEKQHNTFRYIKNLFAVLLIIGIAFYAGKAFGQQCAPYDAAVAELKEKYNEESHSYGIAQNGNLVEVFSSKDETWTIMVVSPNGMACVVADGYNWEVSKPKGQES